MSVNEFILGARQLIYAHGTTVSFVTTTTGQYNVETGSVETTETTVSIKAFPKKLIATQYNAPNLIGQTLTEFLVVSADLTTKPKFQDKVTSGSETYTVHTVKEHMAEGVPIIYKVLCSQG